MPSKSDLIISKLEPHMREKKALNQQECCRIVNGYYWRDVNLCSLTFEDKPFGCSQKSTIKERCPRTKNGCVFSYAQVRTALRKTKWYHCVMKWWDKNKANKRFDTFHFWALTKELFAERVLAQTLIPYLIVGE